MRQPIDEKEIFLMTRAVQNHPEVPPRHTVRAKSRIIATLALAGALGLPGCIDSAAPILTGSQPVFGPHLRVHAYSVISGQASGPEIGAFQWERGQYRAVGRVSFSVAAVTAHPLAASDLILQAVSAKQKDKTEYAVARKLTDATYLVFAIDEEDADEATRTKFCTKSSSSSCRIATREALMAFAQATAAKRDPKGALAIVVVPPGP